MTNHTTAALPRRFAVLIGKLASDTARLPRARSARGIWDAGIDEAIAWMVRSHEVTGRRGSSRGYSLLFGWADAFPETTGYVIGSLLGYGVPRGRDDLVEHARQMAQWEIEVQNPDGGTMQGLISKAGRSIAFNTGMVMHGFVDLHAVTGDSAYLDAARRGGDFLVASQDADGAWRGDASHQGIPHTYKSRVSWALLKLAAATGNDAYRDAAVRNLDWVVAQQQPNGWFENCNFEPGLLPNTHGIAYTLRGLTESHALVGDDRYLEAARLTSRALIEQFERRRTLTATWKPDWTPSSPYLCLTGLAQLGGVWLRLYEIAGGDEFRDAGLRLVEHAAAFQVRTSAPELRGSLPGSFP